VRTVRIEQFEGPLDLLLELIENAKLDVSGVSLAAVTEQYLDALTSATGLTMEELADFLVVAARLLLLKSKALLPGLDDGASDDVLSLEVQLRLYQRFVEASRSLRASLRSPSTLFVREHPLVSRPTFLPPKSISSSTLGVAFRNFLAHVEQPLATPPELIRRTISLQERIRHIRSLLSAREQVSFGELFGNASSRTEIIVTFLALLELVKQRTVALSQDALFAEITVALPPDASQTHA